MKISTKNRVEKYSLYLVSIIFIYLIMWFSYFIIDNKLVAPSPNQIMTRILEIFVSKKSYIIIGNTFIRLIISLAFSFIIGIFLGILSGYYRKMRYFMKPIVTILRTIPIVSIILIILIIFKIEKTPFIVTFLMLFPIVYEATVEGVISIDSNIMDVWKLESNFNFPILITIIIPLIFSYLKASFIQTVGLGFKVLIMAEYIVQTNSSIGKELVSYSNNSEYDMVIAWTIVLLILVIIIEYIPKLIKLLRSEINVKKV